MAAEALGDPATLDALPLGDRRSRWRPTGRTPEAKEHLAGFFLVDVESPERAEELARRFSGPGETVELRPTMWPGGDDQ